MAEAAVETNPNWQNYTAIFYNPDDATLNLVRVVEGPGDPGAQAREDSTHCIPIAEFLTSSTDLPIILTDDGELDVKK